MGHSRNRPIVGETAAGVGATYIIVEGCEDDIRIQADAIGTVTFTVDWTVQNITYDDAARAAVNVNPGGINDARYVDPASAIWNNLITSGTVDAIATLTEPVFAIRIDITAGTGSVGYTIAQA